MKTEKITIESLAYGGDGVGHLEDGRVAFVPYAFPQDICLVEYTDTDDRFVHAKLVELIESSPDRIEAKCPYAANETCGGCPWAVLSYRAQLHWKRKSVVDALIRISKIESEVAEKLVDHCVLSDEIWNYRNKVEFDVGLDVAGRMTLGMHAKAGSFTPLSQCLLSHKKLEGIPKALTGALRYALQGNDVSVERVGVRASRRTGDVQVSLWTSTGKFPRARVAQVVKDCLPVKNASISRIMLKGSAKQRKIAGVESLWGKGYWTERLNGMLMTVSPPSFFQVNTPGAEKLIELVLDGLDIDGLDYVVDLYCGVGTFTLPLAKEARMVAAVEAASSSIKDLRRNLERNDLSARVIGGDAARELESLGAPDKVVVDPPRAGLSEKAKRGLVQSGANAIAYVSCDPSTLARDLPYFIDHGYKIRRITPVDLFPESYHVETVTMLTQA